MGVLALLFAHERRARSSNIGRRIFMQLRLTLSCFYRFRSFTWSRMQLSHASGVGRYSEVLVCIDKTLLLALQNADVRLHLIARMEVALPKRNRCCT